MDLEARIRKLTNALKYCKPDKCEGCKFIHEDSLARSCKLMDGGFDSVIEYELANNEIAYDCPLLEKDSEEYNEIVEQLKLLVELKAARIKLQEIERETKEEIKDPEVDKDQLTFDDILKED